MSERGAAQAGAGPAARPGWVARTFVSLANRDFRFLTLGTVGAGVAQWGQQIGMGWLVFELTGSAAQLGAVVFAGGLLALVLTPAGGLLADRASRRSIVLLSTLAGAAQSAVLAGMILAGVVEVWHVYAFAVANAITMAVNQPARQAYVFDVSTPATLANAVAVNSLAMNLARIVGPPVTGAIAAFSVGSAFVLVAAMLALSTVATALMSRPAQPLPPSGRNPVAEIAEGFRYLAGDRALSGLIVINLLPAAIVYPYVSLLPVFVSDVLGAGSAAYGVLVSAIAVGSTAGLVALAALGDLPRKGTTMLVGFIGYLVCVIAFSQSGALWLSVAILVVAGLFHGLALALNNTLFQLVVKPEMRGRGMAVWQMAFGVMPLGSLPMGVAIEAFGPQRAVAAFVSVCLVCFLGIAAGWRSVRAL